MQWKLEKKIGKQTKKTWAKVRRSTTSSVSQVIKSLKNALVMIIGEKIITNEIVHNSEKDNNGFVRLGKESFY